MIRALALVIALLLCALLLTLAHRVEEQPVTVRASDHEAASINASAVDARLPDNFGELVKPRPRARTAPTHRATSGNGHPCGPAYDLPPSLRLVTTPVGAVARSLAGPRPLEGHSADLARQLLGRHRSDRTCRHWSAC